ncbi:MAG: TlpA family protein disulfide reductase [Chloroflexi bacterium]|nr:TlpA family protein disulfide reductase [Chloroflexota bacterium]
MKLRRPLILLATLVPLAALLALLGWGLGRAGGRPGGGAIFQSLGEVAVKGGPARDFTLSTFGGGALRLGDLRGKVVVIDFWASWCPPCREEAPGLAQVSGEYQKRGVEFVGIAIWDKEKDALGFIRRFSILYPNGLDAQGKIAVDYGVTGIPEKYFVDRSGNLVRKFVGPMTPEKLRSILDELLSQ